MCANRDRLALVDEDDPVRVVEEQRRGGEDHRGPAGPQLPYAVGDPGLGVGVDGGGRFVQDEDLRVRDQRPCQGEPLALAAGEGASAFGDAGVHRVLGAERALRERHQHVPALGGGKGLLRTDRTRGGHVEQFAQRTGQQHRVLVLDEDGGAGRVEGEFVERYAVQEHGGARLGGVSAEAFREPPGRVRVTAHHGGEQPGRSE